MRWFFHTQDIDRRRTQRAERAAWKAEDAELKRECDYFSDRIVLSLAQAGVDHRMRVSDAPSDAQRIFLRATDREMVELLEAHYEPNAIYFWVDSKKLPYMAYLQDLCTPEMLENLSFSCQRRVDFVKESPEKGAWFIVHRNGAIAGIPVRFSFRDAMFHKDEDGNLVRHLGPEARPLKFVVGVRENRKLVTEDLGKIYHLLLGGSAGQGKTTFIHSILLQLMERNPPSKLRVLISDLKDGAEFYKCYRRLPHLWKFSYEIARKAKAGEDPQKRTIKNCGIMRDTHSLVHGLEALRKELQRRQKAVAAEGVIDILGWNRKHKEAPWPYLLLVIDELAVAIRGTDKKLSHKTESYLVDILQRGRSSGIFTILSTQRPAADVVTGAIKANCDGRTAFNVPDISASKVIIDTGDAVRMGPPGRALHMQGPYKLLVQVPHVTGRIIERGTKAIAHKWAGEKVASTPQIDLKQVLAYSVQNLDGSLSFRQLLAGLSNRGLTRPKLENMLRSLDGKPLFVGGQVYRVVKKDQRVGRILVKVEMSEVPPEITV